MIYALHLLEQLQQNGLKFTFKGGTSLVVISNFECTTFSNVACTENGNLFPILLQSNSRNHCSFGFW